MNSKSVLITGASGYIGSHVLQLLIGKNYEIHATSRVKKKDCIENQIFWHQIDLLNTNEIKILIYKIKPRYLIHLAWKIEAGLQHDSLENNEWFSASKFLIKKFFQNKGERILVTGTCAEYDWEYSNLSENTTPLNPSKAYGKSKEMLFNFIESYCKKNKFSFIWPRIFFSFGPFQNRNSLVPFVIKNLIHNQVVKTSEAQQKFDYLFVEDVASALVLSLESNYNGAVNIASGKAIQLKKIILQIAEYFNKRELIQFGAVPYSKDTPMCLLGQNEILKNKVGWIPKYTIEEGLLKTIEHYKKEFS